MMLFDIHLPSLQFHVVDSAPRSGREPASLAASTKLALGDLRSKESFVSFSRRGSSGRRRAPKSKSLGASQSASLHTLRCSPSHFLQLSKRLTSHLVSLQVRAQVTKFN